MGSTSEELCQMRLNDLYLVGQMAFTGWGVIVNASQNARPHRPTESHGGPSDLWWSDEETHHGIAQAPVPPITLLRRSDSSGDYHHGFCVRKRRFLAVRRRRRKAPRASELELGAERNIRAFFEDELHGESPMDSSACNSGCCANSGAMGVARERRFKCEWCTSSPRRRESPMQHNFPSESQ